MSIRQTCAQTVHEGYAGKYPVAGTAYLSKIMVNGKIEPVAEQNLTYASSIATSSQPSMPSFAKNQAIMKNNVYIIDKIMTIHNHG